MTPKTLSAQRPRPTLTKIVATVGPACDSVDMLCKLIQAGVAVFRLNFSHGQLDTHAIVVQRIRAAAKATGQPVAILGDLQGPKIRLGQLPVDGIMLEPGQEVVLTPPLLAGEAQPAVDVADKPVLLPSGYAELARDVEPGDRVLINDGAIRLLAIDREPGDSPRVLRCRVTVGGLATTRKGINLPDSNVHSSAITDQDWRCVEWAVSQGLDYLALSFVRTAEEVRTLKRAVNSMCPVDFNVDKTGVGSMIPIISKIEKPQALQELDAIIEASDGIMVARGDLGVEMDLAEVPLVQRRLIEKCDEWGKPCIVATQMLESMITAASPTRAEVSDVASAILSGSGSGGEGVVVGADAVMLSAETATGKHPALVVETMRRIIEAAERYRAERVTKPSPSARLIQSKYRTAALAHGAWHVARDVGATIVACWSQEGGTARYLSQTGLNVPIVAYSSDERQVRRMSLFRGVTARYMPVPESGTLAEFNRQVEEDLLMLGWVRPGDPIVLVAGKPLGVKGATSSLAIHYTGNAATGYMKV